MKTQARFVFEAVLITAVIIALAAIPRAASACRHGMHQPPAFAEFDKNGDGSISEDEFNTTHAEHVAAMAAAGRKMRGMGDGCSFGAIDTDEDGNISEAELTAHQQSHQAQMQKHKAKMHRHEGGCKDQDEGNGENS